MKFNFAIGSDHAGFEMKEIIKNMLQDSHYKVKDYGTFTVSATDYADYAHPVSLAVEKKECGFGILICGSANGMTMTANKHKGIRAAVCWNEELATLARQHNDANVLCLPARFIEIELSKKIVRRFCDTLFEGGRHRRRIDKIVG